MHLQRANKEIQDLIEIAQFTAVEKQKFLSMVKQEIKSRNIHLDSLI